MSKPRALRFTRSAEKELRRLDPPIRTRVVAALDRLVAEDRSLGVRRLTGSEHYRLRVGDWRVIFDHLPATRTIVVRQCCRVGGRTSDRAAYRFSAERLRDLRTDPAAWLGVPSRASSASTAPRPRPHWRTATAAGEAL